MKIKQKVKKKLYLDEVIALARKEGWKNKEVTALNYNCGKKLNKVKLHFNDSGRLDTSNFFIGDYTWNLYMVFEIEVEEEIAINKNDGPPEGTIFTEVRYVNGMYVPFNFSHVSLEEIVNENTQSLLAVYWDRKNGSFPIKLWDKDLGYINN